MLEPIKFIAITDHSSSSDAKLLQALGKTLDIRVYVNTHKGSS